MANLIHFPCWMELLVMYRNSESVPTISALAKEMDMTYSHAVNVIKSLCKTGLIRTEKDGRTSIVYITMDGKKVGQMLALSKKIIRENLEKNGCEGDFK